MNDKKFIILSSIFFLVFIFGITTLFVQEPISNYLKATNANISKVNSILTATPQVCSLTNKSPFPCSNRSIKANVFVRTDTGNLLPQKTVKITTKTDNTTAKISITPQDTVVTDKSGKAEFILTSQSPVKLDLFAEVLIPNSQPQAIGQNLSVEFVP